MNGGRDGSRLLCLARGRHGSMMLEDNAGDSVVRMDKEV